MPKSRYILHVDMDAFFASCEEAVNPDLKGLPLIVGGTKEDLRSIVSCPNYLARKKGIRTAMPIARALLLAPEGNFIRGTRGIYADYSKRVREIFYKYTPLIEPMSIDEAFLDVTQTLRPFKGDVFALAFALKEDVKNTLDITCSIGISSNKVCSKIASKENKPDGITYLLKDEEQDFLHSLPVERIPGIGKVTLKQLNKYSIFKIGDLLNFDISFYQNEIGMHSGYLLNVANGIDNREINTFEEYDQKSLSKETTLNFNTDDKHYLEKELYYVLERACSRLRKKNYVSNSLTVKVKYADFSINQKSHIISSFSNIEMDFYEDSLALFDKLYSKGKLIRLIGVRFTDLKDDDGNSQENIFGQKDKFKLLIKNMDKIRKKYDYNIIKFGKTFDI